MIVTGSSVPIAPSRYAVHPVGITHTGVPSLSHTPSVIKKSTHSYTFPTIPRGAMLPVGTRNLIVPGRAAAGDREARSAFRIQATCMAMGQAAGALAVLAARTRTDAAAVPAGDLRDLLTAHGAIVPPQA